MKKLKYNTGFTLLEVLIAMVIMAIAFTAVLKVTSNNIANIYRVENRTIAHWVGVQAMNAIIAGTVVMHANSIEMKTNMLGKEWHWQARTSPSLQKGLNNIVILVSLNDDETPIAHLSGVLLSPRESSHAF